MLPNNQHNGTRNPPSQQEQQFNFRVSSNSSLSTSSDSHVVGNGSVGFFHDFMIPITPQPITTPMPPAVNLASSQVKIPEQSLVQFPRVASLSDSTAIIPTIPATSSTPSTPTIPEATIVKKAKKKESETKKKKKKDDPSKEEKKTKEPSRKPKKENAKRKEVPEKEEKKTKKKTKTNTAASSSVSTPTLNSSSSVSETKLKTQQTDKMDLDDIDTGDMIKIVFDESIPKQVAVEIKCLDSYDVAHIDEDVTLGETPIVNGNRVFKEIDWKGVLDNHGQFYNFACTLILSTIASEESLTVNEYLSSIEESLRYSETYNQDLRRNMVINRQNYMFEYNLQTNSILMTFKRFEEIAEISQMLYKIKVQQELEEAEEIEAQEEIIATQVIDIIQVNFEFHFEKEPNKKFMLELRAPKSDIPYKAHVAKNLQLSEMDLLYYCDNMIGESLVEARAILPQKLKDVLSSRVDVKVVHRHVFYEQRVISYEIFERMKDIIGQDSFSSYNHLCFLVCTPDQNTLWHQTMERLERSNILPPNTKLSSVSIKYRKDHVPTFEKFRNRIATEKDTLFILIVDECHYAITKDGAHDKIVNDQMALSYNNFFVLLVSATPYNVLSVDSNIPEVYKLLSDFEDLKKDSKVKVTSTSQEKNGLGILIKISGSSYCEMIKIEDQNKCLEQVDEITGKIDALMTDENEENNFEIGDIVEYYELEDNSTTSSNNNKLKTRRFKVSSLPRENDKKRLEKEVDLSDRDLRKINTSKTKRITTKQIGAIPEDTLVEINDTIKWKVTFQSMDDPSSKEYTLNDWEFKQLTNYEEYNVVSWSEVQKRTSLERTDSDNQTKKYFSKQDYISSLKNGEERLVFKDSEFEKILKKINIASNTLRPILLAIDYHFWIIVEGIRLGLYNESEGYKLLTTINEMVPDIEEQHRRYIELCKLSYLSYYSHKYCGTKDILGTYGVEEDDDDYDIMSEKKKTVKEKKEQTEGKVKDLIDILRKKFNPTNPEQIFTAVSNRDYQPEQPNLSKNLISSLIESGRIPVDGKSSLRGKMKILRITTTDFANTVFKMLRYSISKIPLSGYILPDVLIDTGENPLTLDQLSFISRMKLAEKILSTEDYEIFQKRPTKLKKEKKSLEYINLQNFPCILILVAKGRQGDTFPNSFDCLDMRAKGDSLPNYSSFTQEFGRLCRYVDSSDKKPIALVTDSIFKDLSKCGEGGATSVGNTSMKLDTYMSKMKGKEGQKYWSIVTYCRRTMGAVDGKKLKNEKQSPPSYDSGRSGTDKDISKKLPHKNRILLFAEPQIGKTDSFLHFLERVIHGIETNRMERMVDVNDEEQPHDSTSIIEETAAKKTYSSLEMSLPYFEDLESQAIASYKSLSGGKYAKLVLKTREEVFKEFSPDLIRSVHKLSRIESSLLSSDTYWNKFISKLGNNSFDLLSFQTFDGRYMDILQPKPSSNSTFKILKMNDSTSKPTNIAEKVDLSDKMNIGLADINYKDGLITVHKHSVFGLSIGSLEECFPSEKPQISIPTNKLDWFQISSDKKVTRFVSLNDPNSVRSWIFMPSWNRSAGGLFYMKSMMTIPYRQVIVVRNSEFKCYRNVLGSDFVLLSLPDVIDFTKLTKPPKLDSRTTQYDHKVDDTLLSEYQIKDDVGGIGFSRLVIQLLAFGFGLEFIWMMDDNCHHFERVENGKKIPCSLSEVLLPLEKIVYDDNSLISTMGDVSSLSKRNRTNPNTLCGPNDAISCYTPGKENISVIGIRKDGYRYNPKTNYKPFVNSFTICSLFLLNTKKTVEKGCLFPARRYLEDIEFEYLCIENGLNCIKAQHYFLYKPANPLRVDYSPPSNVPTLFEIQDIDQILSNNSVPPATPPSTEFEQIKTLISGMTVTNHNMSVFDNLGLKKVVFEEIHVPGDCFYLFLTNKDLQAGKVVTFINHAADCLSAEHTYYSPHQDVDSTKELVVKFMRKQ